jgi:hypothetical protein
MASRFLTLCTEELEAKLREAEMPEVSVELAELEVELWEAEALVDELLDLEFNRVILDDRELDRVLLGLADDDTSARRREQV